MEKKLKFGIKWNKINLNAIKWNEKKTKDGALDFASTQKIQKNKNKKLSKIK